MMDVKYRKKTPQEAVEALQRGEPLLTFHNPVQRFAYSVNNRFVDAIQYIFSGQEAVIIDQQGKEILRKILIDIIKREYQKHSTMMRCNICGKKRRLVLYKFDQDTQFYYRSGNSGYTPYLYMRLEVGFRYFYEIMNLLRHCVNTHKEVLHQAYGISTSDEKELVLFLYDKVREYIFNYLGGLQRRERLSRPSSKFSMQFVEYRSRNHYGLNLVYPKEEYSTINRAKTSLIIFLTKRKKDCVGKSLGRNLHVEQI